MPQSRPSLAELQPRRVCLIKPSALGDVVQTLPVLSMLRARWPDAHLAWVINQDFAGLLTGHPELDQVIEFDRRTRGRPRWFSLGRLARQLRSGEFDLAIDLQGLARSGLMALTTGAPRRVGGGDAREGARWTYTDCIPMADRPLPALERYRRVAAALGCDGAPPPAKLGIREHHRDMVRQMLGHLPRPWLVIHPGASWETKRWPSDHFVQLAQQAKQEFGATIVLSGGPSDAAACAKIAARLAGETINLAGQTSLLELAAICRACDVFLSGDTGPMHLAAAVGTPVVSVFTCTSPLRAAPRGQEHRVVGTGVCCAASYRKHCGLLACMSELGPERVWPVLRATLAECMESGRPRRVHAAQLRSETGCDLASRVALLDNSDTCLNPGE